MCALSHKNRALSHIQATDILYIFVPKELLKKEKTMEHTLSPVDWYMRILEPLNPTMKLDIIGKLSESLKNKVGHVAKTTSHSDFFDELTGAWEDEHSVEDEMSK